METELKILTEKLATALELTRNELVKQSDTVQNLVQLSIEKNSNFDTRISSLESKIDTLSSIIQGGAGRSVIERISGLEQADNSANHEFNLVRTQIDSVKKDLKYEVKDISKKSSAIFGTIFGAIISGVIQLIDFLAKL